jgi:hypothetical protein
MTRLDYGRRSNEDGEARDDAGAAPGKRTLTQTVQRRSLAEGTAPPISAMTPARGADPFDFSYGQAGAVQRQAKGGDDPPSITVRGVKLTADAGETEFRAIEAKLTRAELTELRRCAEDSELAVVAVLGREALRQGVAIDEAGIAAGRAIAHAYVAWVAPQADVDVWVAALRDLEAQTKPASLPATTIATLRGQVATLPPSLRAPWYQLLHDKVGYDNQRDNTSKLEEDDGGTCNLTSVSMSLEGMGYDVDPDGLITTVMTDHPKATSTDAQAKVIEGVGMREAVESASGDAMTTWMCAGSAIHTAAFWTDVVRPALGCGHGVFLGARGHVIRVQRVDDEAVVVDDPYGAWSFADDKWAEKNHRGGKTDGLKGDAGADSTWAFADGALAELVWVRIIAPATLTGSELSHVVTVQQPDARHVVIGGASFVID